MSDSFTIELWQYWLYELDKKGALRKDIAALEPARWSRHWSDPTPNLTQLYQHILETAQEWQARQVYHGSQIELIAEGERMVLIDFPPQEKLEDEK